MVSVNYRWNAWKNRQGYTLAEIEKLGASIVDSDSNNAWIMDGMAILQKTFIENILYRKTVFPRIFAAEKKKKRTDAILDVYLDCSIKNDERYKPGEKDDVISQNISTESFQYKS